MPDSEDDKSFFNAVHTPMLEVIKRSVATWKENKTKDESVRAEFLANEIYDIVFEELVNRGLMEPSTWN